MIIEEIILSKDNDSRRKAIQDNLGQQVILNDDYYNWCHGILLEQRYDNQVYQMKMANGRGQKQLHDNDLNQLLILLDHPGYRTPKID
ncbi:MAG: hypothetical protein U9R34_04790 [Nanoarchaeota archaeon]|nr:hypothetical protein [Nanoarchaeota archaeon]